MPILVDYSQVFIANLMQQPGINKTGVNENLVRHMVLNTLRSYRNKFYNTHGELIICCDNKNYWRKKVFPYYKAHRKKYRKDSDHDWNQIFDCLNKVKAELVQTFPYKVIEIKTAEADDVIAILCKHYNDQPVLILSGDKDFVQLQVYDNVEQYSPSRKEFLKEENPKKFLREHIMKGDRGDGIPNFMSKDDCFVNGSRQKPLRASQVEKWAEFEDAEVFCNHEMLRGYRRNELLVDLNNIPDAIQEKILDDTMVEKEVDRSQLLPYFIEHNLKNLTEYIQDF